MEPGSSLPHLQVAAACPYSEPHQYRLCPPSHFLKIHLNIIPSTRGSSKWYFSFNYHHQILYTPLHSPINSTCLIHLMHGSFTRTVLGRSTDNLGFSLCSFFRSPVTSFLVGPNILRSTVFSNKLSLRSSLILNDQFSHPYKTTGKIVFLCISICVFWITKWNTRILHRLTGSIP